MASPDEPRLNAIAEAIADIRRAQAELDGRLLRIEATLGLNESLPTAEPPPLEPAPPEFIAEQPRPRPAPAPLETRIGLTLISRAGALTLVLGIGFFFKWAADNHWIGPAGRVILGLLAGCAALGAGEVFLRRGQRILSQALTGVGIAILYLAFYASYGFYNLLAQSLAFALMAGVTALAGLLASRQKALPLAVMGLIGGFVTPLLLSSGEDRPWFLFSYVLVLDLGAFALIRRERWRALEIFSFAGTVILFGLWLSELKPEDRFAATFFGLLYYAFFALTAMQPIVLIAHALVAALVAFVWRRDIGVYFPLALLVAFAGLAISDRRRWPAALSVSFASFWVLWATVGWGPGLGALFLGLTCGFVLFASWIAWRTAVRRETPGLEDLAVIALNGGAYFGFCYYLLNERHHAWMGLFAIALAGVHVAMGVFLRKWDTRDDGESSAALLSLGVALCFLTLAVPIQLTAYRITMAWALEAAALTWIGVRVRRRALISGALVILGLVMLRLVLIDAWIYSSVDAYATLLNARFLTFAVSAASLFAAAIWLRPRREALACYVAGHAVLLGALTQETLGWAGRNAAPENLVSVETFSISVLYAIYAVLWIGLGVATRTAVNRITGLLLIGFVVLKLYLFDVWQLGRLYRILAFVALGVLLLATSFLYSHFRTLIESWWKDDLSEPPASAIPPR
jgi:uncharacterized membrane protein